MNTDRKPRIRFREIHVNICFRSLRTLEREQSLSTTHVRINVPI